MIHALSDDLSPPRGGGTDWIAHVADALAGPGWCALPGQIPPELCGALRGDLARLRGLDALRPAEIGPAGESQRVARIRGDRIRWMDGDSLAQAAYLALLEQLRRGLNRHLFLGLDEVEAHYAHYPPGARYARHLDAFRGHNLRRVSSVCYLNPAWQPGDGGELLIYRDDQVIASVPPLNGSLVVFLSETIPHEVVTTTRDRASIAGWFRVRPLDGEGLRGA